MLEIWPVRAKSALWQIMVIYEKTALRVWSLPEALLGKARKRKMSLLLKAVPDAGESIRLSGAVDLDEAREEGTSRQRSVSNSSKEQDEDLEKRNGALLRIVCALA